MFLIFAFWTRGHLQDPTSAQEKWYDMYHPEYKHLILVQVCPSLFPAAFTKEGCTDKEVKERPPVADGYPGMSYGTATVYI